MSEKKLTIYIKTSLTSDGYIHKFDVKCHCGRCVMPECAKCQNCNKCNIVDFLRRRNVNVEYNPTTSKNRTATIVAQNIRALGRAYEYACVAKELCQCKPKQTTK